ncbi:MAG: arylesterase [Nitrosomonadales bacterium]|nr:arylesterase [Nitrosomonadales bacterium]MBK9160697.1 arylesterase [Nitrosomonadales bacterium]
MHKDALIKSSFPRKRESTLLIRLGSRFASSRYATCLLTPLRGNDKNRLVQRSHKSTWQRFLLAALALLAVACGEKAGETALPAGSTVLALGDSLTAGAGVSAEEAWPALLASRTGWDIINGGINGNTSSDALKRLPGLLDQHDPALVLVTLGGNDMLRHLPEEETVANLEQIIGLVRQHGAKPVLLATPKPSLAGAVFQNLSPPDFYRQVADAQHVPLIEDAVAEVLSDPKMKGDPLHPNAEGHVLLSGKLFDALQSIGYAR